MESEREKEREREELGMGNGMVGGIDRMGVDTLRVVLEHNKIEKEPHENMH